MKTCPPPRQPRDLCVLMLEWCVGECMGMGFVVSYMNSSISKVENASNYSIVVRK